MSAPSVITQACLLNAVGGNPLLVAYPVITPLYETADVQPYNLNFPIVPAAVTFPETAEQVSAIVQCAAKGGYKVQAKSGGHSYGNYCLGGVDGEIVVDMSNFQQFSMNYTNYYATFGAGTLLGTLDDKLDAAGGRAIAHGTSPEVGFGGHATIGGLGPTSRQFGMALDHIESAQVVLANGSIVTASETQYPDVFFSIKGAGASFGIVTEFTCRTEPEPGTAVEYQYIFNIGDTASRANTFKAWQKFISQPDLPRELASILTVATDSMVISGTYFGSLAAFEALEIESQFPANQGSNVTVFNNYLALLGSYVESGFYLASGGVPAYFYAKSLDFTPSTLIPDSVVDEFFTYIDTANAGTELWFVIFDLEGGAINDVPTDATAYSHRDALFWLQSYAISVGPTSSTTSDFLDGINDIYIRGMPNANFGAYPGYVDPQLANAQEAYWGANLAKLEQIKAEIDPNDVFHNPQSVPVGS